jgi:hypothetical protein
LKKGVYKIIQLFIIILQKNEKSVIFLLTLTRRQTLGLILGGIDGITDNKPGLKAVQNINQNTTLLRADWVDTIYNEGGLFVPGIR